MEIRIYRPTDKTKFCAGKLCKYDRTPVIITTPEEMKAVIRYDHVFCKYKNQNQIDLFPPEIGWRNETNFEASQTLWADFDNSHSENPADWVSIGDIKTKFAGIKAAYYTSKSHLKEKEPKDKDALPEKPRPKWHACFPLSREITTIEEMDKLLDRIKGFIAFQDYHKPLPCDTSVFERSRQFFGSGENENAQIIFSDEEGSRCFDELDLHAVDEEMVRNVFDGLAMETDDDRELSPLARKLRQGMELKAGQGQHMWVFQATESLWLKSGLNWKEVEAIIKVMVLGIWKHTPKEWAEGEDSFKGKFEEGRRWISRKSADAELMLQQVMTEYDKKYTVMWWGQNKVLWDNKADTIKELSGVECEEILDERDKCYYNQYDRKLGKTVLRMGHKFSYWYMKRRQEQLCPTFNPALPAMQIVVEDGVRKYNLFRGMGCEPDPSGSWKLTREFIFEVICRSDPERYEFLLDWMARIVKDPLNRPRVLLALYSKDHGTGKGTFFFIMSCLLGEDNYLEVSDIDKLVQRFNALASNKLLVFLDECYWPGDSKSGEVLKNLITSDWEIVERKNIDSEKMKTYKSVGIASNRVRYAQVEPSNRRIACYDVSNAHMKDWDYFAAIREEIANGGKEAMMADLSIRDTSKRDFENTIPKTPELFRQMKLGFSKIDNLIYESLLTGQIDESLEVRYETRVLDFQQDWIANEDFDVIWERHKCEFGERERTGRGAREVMKTRFPKGMIELQVRPKGQRKGLQRWGMALHGSLDEFRKAFADYCGMPVEIVFPLNKVIFDSPIHVTHTARSASITGFGDFSATWG